MTLGDSGTITVEFTETWLGLMFMKVLSADITLVLLNSSESRVASCCDYTLCVVHTCDDDDDYDDHDDDVVDDDNDYDHYINIHRAY
jgi:hypothetical protein